MAAAGERTRSVWVRPGTVVAALAIASAVVAVALSAFVFPHLSVNNDEPIYRLHAQTIAAGHLFPPAPAGLADQFRPWLGAVDGAHYVLKYNPALPLLLAASLLVTGGYWLFLGAAAAAATVMTWMLAREVLGEGWDAVVAAALIAVSPVVILQSALLLPYVATFVLLEAFCWGVLRARRTEATRPLATAGLALGAAFVIRPYDAVLFAPPILLWAVVSRPRPPNWLTPSKVLAFAAPAALAASGFFVYNAIATGDPLRPSFSLLEPQDTLGFGIRRLYPSDPPHSFGLREGIQGLVHHGTLLDTWLAGGVVLLALGAVALLRRRGGSAGPWLTASGGLFLAGYVFFWGPWNATLLWGGTKWFGPFYFLPVCIPAAILGARGLCDLFRAKAAFGALAGVGILAVSTPTLVRAVADNHSFNSQTQALANLVAHGPSPKLVVSRLPTPFLMHPSPVVANDWDLRGRVVYSIEDTRRDLDMVAAHPERTAYLLTFDDDFKSPDVSFNGRLEQLRVARGPSVELHVTFRAGQGGGRFAVDLAAFGSHRTFVLDDAAAPGATYDERVVLDASGPSIPDLAATSVEPSAPNDGLSISVAGTSPAAAETVPARHSGEEVTALLPAGPSWTAGSFAPGAINVRG